MEIRYVTTDLDFESLYDLSPIVREMGDKALPNHNDWVDNTYFVVLAAPTDYDDPESTIVEFCNLIEGLSEKSKKLWYGCQKRVADIAFESGKIPNNLSCHLSDKLIARLSELKIGITITIYPVGHYSYESTNNLA